ncbi:sulfatase-like hydrolase/transferase [Candidatus Bathyarchaeota archaeon]|nr:sulfatase-like hydrolase/transferase [Candidatus Bathyarchaeota archaeon]
MNPSLPNVLYITTHDQGIAAACYAKYGPGASVKMHTPNTDALASNGAMLTTHFGTAPQCSPARSSLITGLLPHENGLVGLTHRGFKITDPEKTILNHFNNHGYKTMLVGFQHEVQGEGTKIGYQEIFGRRKRMCHQLLDDVDDAMEKVVSANERGQPAWLSIGAKEVHLSWEKFIDKSQVFSPNDVEVPGYLPDTPKIRKHLGAFYGALESYDDFLGKVFSLLDQKGLMENTIIIVTTDHGIAHPRAKGTLYDPGNHDLMIWSWKGHIPRGKKIHSLLSSVDFAPTICELCKIPAAGHYRGKSYASLLLSREMEEQTEIREYVFTELTYHDIYNPMRAVRTKKLKYIKVFEPSISLVDSIPGDIMRGPSYKEWVRKGTNTTREAEELFDLVDDPLEEHNLAGDPAHANHLASLREVLERMLEQTKDPLKDGAPYPCPEGARINNHGEFNHIPPAPVMSWWSRFRRKIKK